MKLSEVMNNNKIKSRVGFDSEGNLVETEEPNVLAGNGFKVFDLDIKKYEELLSKTKDKTGDKNGLKFLYDIIDIITDLENDVSYEDFEFKISEGSATTLEFITIIANVYKDLEKFQKLYYNLEKVNIGVNKLVKELMVDVGELKE